MEQIICKTCVMDSSVEDIIFDKDGICNFCNEAKSILPRLSYTEDQERENLTRLMEKVKREKKGKYDSIIGLSGGVDSSYIAYLAKEFGLNPLTVHFDNGWNSELAVDNIHKIVNKCGFDLETLVINWKEFRDLQRSFIKAGVVDIEMLSDQAIFATMFKLRRKFGIKNILSGTNYRTEHGMPRSWVWNKTDTRNIKDIHGQFGTVPLNSFPTINTFRFRLSMRLGIGGTFLEPLNVINYNKKSALETLKTEFDWRYYGGKHYESIFTKFYQAYILPTKFGIDKRKVHFSALIRNGEITRDQALQELRKPLYDESELKSDREFVLKKLGFSDVEFNDFMKEKPRSHSDFKNEEKLVKMFSDLRVFFNAKSTNERLNKF